MTLDRDVAAAPMLLLARYGSGLLMRFAVIALSTLVAALDRRPESAARENEQPAARSVAVTELPPVTTTRWTARRKAAVVAAASEGLLTHEEVYRRYHVSAEEFTSWQQRADRRDAHGLRATQDSRLPEDGSERADRPTKA
jgi:hypothetical protein